MAHIWTLKELIDNDVYTAKYDDKVEQTITYRYRQRCKFGIDKFGTFKVERNILTQLNGDLECFVATGIAVQLGLRCRNE